MDLLTCTPVQSFEGYYFKRDDLFRPLHILNINGGKARQCIAIITGSQPKEILSYSSIFSPQLLIVSALANHFNIPLKYFVGSNMSNTYTETAEKLGCQIIRLPCARESYLLSQAKKAANENSKIIKSGIIDTENIQLQIEVTSMQCKNIPNNAKTIIVTCGSGLTAIGIVVGVIKFRKKVKCIVLIATAPDRKSLILKQLNTLKVDFRGITLIFHSLYGRIVYKTKKPFKIGALDLHPQYEAKTFKWAIENLNIHKPTTLFWVVGGEII